MKSVFRAVRFGGGRGGGSTITQQLAKLLLQEMFLRISSKGYSKT